jgi:lanthionine-containing peptide SapB
MALLDLQGMESPLSGGGGGGGGGSTNASNASLLLPCSHSTVSLLACYKQD